MSTIYDIELFDRVEVMTVSGQRIIIDVEAIGYDVEDRDSLECEHRVFGYTVEDKPVVLERMSTGRLRVARLPYSPAANVESFKVM